MAENSVDSTICNCKNSADICGDINVSGITGAMVVYPLQETQDWILQLEIMSLLLIVMIS